MAKTIAATLAIVCLTAACSGTPASEVQDSQAPSEPAGRSLQVEELASGLEHPWDIGFLPDGKLIVTERPGRLTLFASGRPGARKSEIRADLSDVFAVGEGGLMGIVIHPDFATSRQFTTCQTHAEGGEPVDVRLVTWRLADDDSSASKVKTLVSGMPINSNGRHSGCRAMVAPDGALLVGTGDAADAAAAQDRKGLGGKVLRVDLETGEGLPDNPFGDSPDADTRRLFTYGHRNIQGIALQPGTDRIFTAEHGPDVDDEVNVIEAGGNYGWDPSQGGSVDDYDESVSMTDLERFPAAVRPQWTTGDMTEALCDAEFLEGDVWGELAGSLALTALRGSKLLLLKVDGEGKVASVAVPEELDGTYSRLRAARLGPDGALYVTTSNGDDHLLRVTPGS